MGNLLSARTLGTRSSFDTLWFVLLSWFRPCPSATILNKDLLCFFPSSSGCTDCCSFLIPPPTPPPARVVSPVQLPFCPPPRDARLGAGTPGSPRHCVLPSEPPAVTSAGPVWCHDADGIVGKHNFTGLSSVGDTWPPPQRFSQRRREEKRHSL